MGYSRTSFIFFATLACTLTGCTRARDEGGVDDMRVSRQMMGHLASWVLRSGSYHGSGSSGTPSEAETKRMRERWKSWLPEHREAVLKENGFPLGDPRLDPDLFFSGAHWYTGLSQVFEVEMVAA